MERSNLRSVQNIFGLLLHVGMIQISRVQDYCKTDRLFILPVCREHMSRNRFLLILWCFHFYSEDEEPEVMNYFTDRMKNIYKLRKEMSLDERQGRLGFRQYVKNKRHKNDLKLYHMSSIDQQEQLLSYHPCEHKTVRWSKKLLMLNTFKLYNEYPGQNKLRMYVFRLSVINGLLLVKPAPQILK